MSYAGDVSSLEAWRALAEDPKAVLIDVRTAPEWGFVGTPDLGSIGKVVARLSWQVYPTMQIDPSFADKVEALVADHGAPIFFLCRSGARSRAAAEILSARGYARAFNVADGFEGPPDEERHRGHLRGWKASGLPWTQD